MIGFANIFCKEKRYFRDFDGDSPRARQAPGAGLAQKSGNKTWQLDRGSEGHESTQHTGVFPFCESAVSCRSTLPSTRILVESFRAKMHSIRTESPTSVVVTDSSASPKTQCKQSYADHEKSKKNYWTLSAWARTTSNNLIPGSIHMVVS